MYIYVMFGILNLLVQNTKVTAKQLAEVFEISTRSVYRYIDALECSGIPVISYLGKKGGFSVNKTCFFDKHFFSQPEIETLLLCLKNENQATENKNLNENFKSLTAKLKVLLTHNNTKHE